MCLILCVYGGPEVQITKHKAILTSARKGRNKLWTRLGADWTNTLSVFSLIWEFKVEPELLLCIPIAQFTYFHVVHSGISTWNFNRVVLS